ncbi:hypothetical protein FRC17_005431 [Serendipita sp. 399]|nr:hypothetical protein FRC17_005431 [Serendipita sp. 399]
MAQREPLVKVLPPTPAANGDLAERSLGITSAPNVAASSTSLTSLTPSERITTVLSQIKETVQSPTAAFAPDEKELPPDIPGKDDKLPEDVPGVPVTAQEAEDDEIGEEWRIEPEGLASIPVVVAQAVSSPVAAVGNAATAVSDGAIQAAQTIKEGSNMTYTLVKEGHWQGGSPAEFVAMNLIVPILPRPHRKTYQFTLGGMQGAITRLYLACQPLWIPFSLRMVALMTWENPRRSFLYCTLFWILWFFDLLLPVFFARLCFSLLRRRFLPYPTAQELIERRNATVEADIVGSQIRTYLDSNINSKVGLKDAWNMFRLATKNKKRKAKTTLGDLKTTEDPEPVDYAREEETSTRAVLAILEEIADFHERFSNLIHWRDPEASKRYAIILAFMIFVPFIAPAKYVVKGTYAVGGIGFWFVPNLWAALPLEHRSRIPPPLGDVPTDAEYAMNIISQRVDRGEAVLPSERRKKEKRRSSANTVASRSNYNLNPSATFSMVNKSNSTLGLQDDDTEGDVIAGGDTEKSKAKKIRQRMKNVVLVDQKKRSETHDEGGELLPEETFPAKYHAAMGMITLTPSALFFYPMMSSNAKVSIPLSAIRGVKKSGRMGGLKIKYVVQDEGSGELSGSPRRSMEDGSSSLNAGGTILERISTAAKNDVPPITVAVNGEPLEKEEKFGWVSGRDELFAKLVGWGGRRWVKL